MPMIVDYLTRGSVSKYLKQQTRTQLLKVYKRGLQILGSPTDHCVIQHRIIRQGFSKLVYE